LHAGRPARRSRRPSAPAAAAIDRLLRFPHDHRRLHPTPCRPPPAHARNAGTAAAGGDGALAAASTSALLGGRYARSLECSTSGASPTATGAAPRRSLATEAGDATAAGAEAAAPSSPPSPPAAPASRETLLAAAGAALRVARLAALTLAHRDAAVAAEQLHAKDVAGVAAPLARPPALPRAPGGGGGGGGGPGAAGGAAGLKFPMLDVSALPDKPDGGPALRERYMDKITCWQQLLPPHVEVSYQAQGGVVLWPPQEAVFPTFVDFDAAVRGLQPHVRRTRTRRFRFSRRRRALTLFRGTKLPPGAALL
jgi:hypothetical protein